MYFEKSKLMLYHFIYIFYKNIYFHCAWQTVAEQKDVTKIVMMLASSMSSLREPVAKALSQFADFKQVLELDRETTIQAWDFWIDYV